MNVTCWLILCALGTAAQPIDLWVDSTADVHQQERGGAGVVWAVGTGRVAMRHGPGNANTRSCGTEDTHLLILKGGEDPAVVSAVAAACEILPTLSGVWGPGTRALDQVVHPPTLRPLSAFSLLWWLALPAMVPRTRAAIGWATAALATRWLLVSPSVLMSGDYPYHRLLASLGHRNIDPQNGDGFAAILGWIALATDFHPHLPHGVNLVLAGLTAAWLHEATRTATGSSTAAHGAAALWVSQPLAIAMSTTEGMFPLVAALQVAAWAAWCRGGRHRWFAALSLGLLVHVRPLQLLIVAAWILLWAKRDTWRPLALVVVMMAWRSTELLTLAWQSGVAPGSSGAFDQATPLGWHVAIMESPSSLLVTDPTLVPFWLLPLAIVGISWGWRHHRTLLIWLLTTLAITLVTTAHQARLTDIVRFQLPALLWWSVLGGIALSRIPRTAFKYSAVAGVFAGAGWVIARSPLSPRPAWTQEHGAIAAQQRALPAGTTVHYDPAWDHHGTLTAWLSFVGPARWVPLSDTLAPGDLVWQGRAARWPSAMQITCALEPLTTGFLTPHGGDILDLGDTPIPAGLFRVTDCPSSE
jgi:hypothetical protein